LLAKSLESEEILLTFCKDQNRDQYFILTGLCLRNVADYYVGRGVFSYQPCSLYSRSGGTIVGRGLCSPNASSHRLFVDCSVQWSFT